MRFVDDEFLLLSRTGRFSPGASGRPGRPMTREERARQELAVHLDREPRQGVPRVRAVYLRVRSRAAAVTSGPGRRQYGSER
jgi:hypothetical protein